MVETALCFVFLVPLMIGSVGVGLSLTRAEQTRQISRDAGHMFARGVDFSLSGNQQMVVQMAYGLGMTTTGGNGVVILTRLLQVGANECTAGGLTTAQCTNLNQTVITQRLLIGNSSLKTSTAGTPPSQYLDSQGVVSAANYLKQTSLRVSNFSTTLALQTGETCYMSEAYFMTDSGAFGMAPGVFARSIF